MTDQVEAPAEAEAPAEGQVASEAQAAEQPNVEDKAKRLGWTPQDQFKGDPARWVDAETFVKRGEEVLPIVQANNRKLEKALDKARDEIADLKATFKEFGQFHDKTVKATYDRAKRELEGRLEQAAEVGDVDAVKAATNEISALDAEMREAPKPKDGPDPKFVAAFEDWQEDNEWFGKDRAMTAVAHDIDDELSKTDMTPKQRFAELTKRVKAEFPHKFTNSRRDGPSAVEGSSQPNGRKAAKDWSDLSPEAKKQADRFIAAGILKDRAAFLRTYQW
jgi:hypothetical protein